jgi:hypothetical protein
LIAPRAFALRRREAEIRAALPRNARQHPLDLLVHDGLAGISPELSEPEDVIDEATEAYGRELRQAGDAQSARCPERRQWV